MPIWSWFGMVTSQHAVPLTMLSWFLMYKAFGFQAQYYIWSAILLHSIASLLTYYLALRLSGNKKVAFLTTLLFALNSRAAQAYTHLAVYTATISSTILILSFFILLDKLSKKLVLHQNRALILLGIFFLTISFREDGMILPVLLPVYLFLFNKEYFRKKNIGFFALFYSGVLLYVVYRFSQQLHSSLALSITGLSYLKILFYNALSLPFKLVVQNIFEGIDLFNLFWTYKKYFYTEYHNQITVGLMYTVVYDFVILAVWNALTATFWLITRKIQDRSFWRPIIFCLAWIVAAGELLSVVGRPLNVVESRYLYLSSFAVLFVVSQTLVALMNMPKGLLLRFIVRLAVAAAVVAMVWYSYTEMQVTIRRYVFQSQARKHVLEDLVRLHPTVPDTAVFYVTCKNTCWKNGEYFGIPNDLVLPYTSGPGWIFMLHYARHNEPAYAPLFAPLNGHEFLWDYGEEGFRRIGKIGFGFFRTKVSLEQALVRGGFTADDVIGLQYDERDFSLQDVTGDVRHDIAVFMATQSAALK
jgi:hypothetical protein